VDTVGDQLGADTRRLSMALARHIAAAEVEVPSTIRNTSLLRHVAVEAEIAARLDDDVRVPASLKGIVDDAFSSGRGPRRVAEHFRAAAQDIAAVRLAPTTTTSDINATYDESCVATHVGPHEVHRTTLMVARSLLDDEARQLRASGPQLLELSALTEASAPSPIAPLRKAGSSATPRPNQSGLLTPSPVADSGFPSLTLGVQRPSGPASRTD
jgi:hypothetical protein